MNAVFSGEAATAAERSVLGAVFLDPTCLDLLLEHVSRQDFYDDRHRLVLSAMCRVMDAGQKLDIVSVAAAMESHGDLDRVGGMEFISSLDCVVTTAPVVDHAKMVRGYGRLRSVNETADMVSRSARLGHHDEATHIVDKAVESLLGMDREETVSAVSIRSAVERAILDTHERARNKTPVIGVTSGFTPLDRILGGFSAGNLFILTGPTGRGKTTLALNFAIAAAKANASVFFASLEMAHTDLARRLLSVESGIDAEAIRTGLISEDDHHPLLRSASELKAINEGFMIIDKPGLHISALRRIIRARRTQHPVDLVIVDYLQLLQGEPHKTREREVAKLSSDLLCMARESNCAVLALSQINADGQVRESRAVEHDAAVIMRIDYDDDISLDEPAPDCTLRVLKNRHGRTGNVHMTFFRHKQRFGIRRAEDW